MFWRALFDAGYSLRFLTDFELSAAQHYFTHFPSGTVGKMLQTQSCSLQNTTVHSGAELQNRNKTLISVVFKKKKNQTSVYFYSFQLVSTYTLLIEVRDMAGQPFGLCTTGTAVIKIEDTNDNAPTFKQLQVSLHKLSVKDEEIIFITFLISSWMLLQV